MPVLLDKFLTAMAESREALGQVAESRVAGLLRNHVFISQHISLTVHALLRLSVNRKRRLRAIRRRTKNTVSIR